MTDEVSADVAVDETPIDESQETEITEESEGAELSGESDGIQAETEEELQGEIQDAIDAGASEEQVKEMVEEFVLKVNGKEVKKTIDWNDKESIKRELQKSAAFGQTSQENAEIKKLLQDLTGGLKNDPWAILEELGLNPDELAEMRIQNKIEEMKKSPDQVAREKIQAELEEMRKKTKEYEDREKNQEMEKLQAEATQQLNEEINQALDAHPSLSASEMTIRRIADTMVYAMDKGFEDVSVSDVLPVVEKEMKQDIRKFMDSVPVQFLEEYISQQALDGYRKSKLDQIKKTQNVSNTKKDVSQATTKKEEIKKKWRSVEEMMRSR